MNRFTKSEASMLLQVLRPRLNVLAELLAVQIQALPPGDDSWAHTEEALELCASALQKLEAIK
jgi:hypothetical protein